MSREPTPAETEAVNDWLARNRCCGSPSACGAVCFDDEESWTTTLVARELDRFRKEANRANPTAGLWDKRNTPSGHFEAVKRSGDIFKGVKREN